MNTTKTYKCVCGHIAYYIKGKGWNCFCGQPKPFVNLMLINTMLK